jgi:hypothetical protein
LIICPQQAFHLLTQTRIFVASLLDKRRSLLRIFNVQGSVEDRLRITTPFFRT